MLPCFRCIENGQQELDQLQQEGAKLAESRGVIESDLADKQSDIQALQTEKEIQAGGEVKELQQEADALSMK